MEFKELTNCEFKQNSIHAFDLTSSDFNVALLGSTSEAVVLEMKHSALGTHTFPFTVETIRLPKTRPTTEIVRKFNLAEIYSQTPILNRQYFALDPTYVSELSEELVKIQPVTIAWAPKHVFGVSTLAIVSNDGTCELRHREAISREWNELVCNFTQLYNEIFPFPQDFENTFDELREAVENMCTTYFSWNLDPTYTQPIFVTTNAVGWILLFRITENGLINCYAKHKTSLGRISYVCFMRNFILACSVNGIIQIFKINNNQIEECDTLWPKADRVPCKKIHISFCTKINKWIVVTSKGSHVIVFFLSVEGKVLLKQTKYLGNIQITGFDMLSTMEYIFATITGCVKLVKIKIVEENVELHEERIKYDFDYANYQILGLVASPNRVVWTFIMFHNKPYTQTAMYSAKDAILSVCRLNIKDSFEMLLQDTGPDYFFLDCAEVIRMEILKDNISAKFENICIQDVKIDKQFLRKLQLQLLVLNAAMAYQRMKFNHVKKVLVNEISSLIKIIEYIYINLRLTHLRALKNHTPFQLLSGKCMKYRLELLHAELIPEEDVFRNVRENLNTLSDCHLMDLRSMFDEGKENCSYCESPVDFSTLMCASSHAVPRCAISYLQVPLLTKKSCSSCFRLLIDDVAQLKSIFVETEKLKCTFCGTLIET